MTQKKVTFDTNVFQPVIFPGKFSNDQDSKALESINCSLKDGKIAGFVAETIVDLEQIPRRDRYKYFNGASEVKIAEIPEEDGSIGLSVSVGPKSNVHPGVNQNLTEALEAGFNIGVRVMRCPRAGTPPAPNLDDQWFVWESSENQRAERQKRFFKVLREIERRGVGIAAAKEIGDNLAKKYGKNVVWHKGLECAQSSQEINQVADGVAEWADGDSLAAHIAYENDFFCTRDHGVSAGTSILDQSNREWIYREFAVKFVTPKELIEELEPAR